ncbi:hypothetical protein [Methanothrix soehngenii]|uniref:hypothetical protein n=1 Tax=Methanothrix soehngenii TaxID=2223 RepID=UPI00300D7C37
MTKVTIDDIVFDDPDQDIPRNPGPLDIEWWYEHRVQEYKISGYKDMTQRTLERGLATLSDHHPDD